jgi:Putative translation initiation inhibitor, yjgF family
MEEGQTEHRLPISPYRRLGDQIFVSGQGAVNSRGEYISDDFETQFRHTMELLKGILADAGVTLADVVQVRSYVQRTEDIPLYNRLYREYFGEPYPARTTIVNCLPPGLLFEIDCIASAAARAGE